MDTETKALVLRVLLATVFTCVAFKWVIEQIDPTKDKKMKAKKQATALMTKLKIKKSIQVLKTVLSGETCVNCPFRDWLT